MTGLFYFCIAMIRAYTPKDKPKVIQLLRLNTPEYFAASEEADLVKYLENEADHYFVVELENEVVGAGGINFFEGEKVARISWDMFHPNKQGKGWGTSLVTYRVNRIKENNSITTVVVRTSQLAYKFYEKQGFELKEIVNDFWAKGFHLYHMEMKIK